jgi:steroid delta-isomerase-like uncharacterized protein
MTHAENKDLARRFLQAWSAGGQGLVDELAHPDLVVSYPHWGEPVRGREAFKALLTQTFAFFPDMRIEAEELLAEGDRVVVRWTYTATHQNHELFGVQPSGKPVRVAGFTMYKISNGKVIEESGLVDSFSLLSQLGAAPQGDA